MYSCSGGSDSSKDICKLGCGNGSVDQDTEECDDGNNNNLDGCSSSCRSEVPAGTSPPPRGI